MYIYTYIIYIYTHHIIIYISYNYIYMSYNYIYILVLYPILYTSYLNKFHVLCSFPTCISSTSMTPVMSSSAAGAASDTTAGGASEIATCWAAWRLRLRRTRDTWRYHKQILIVYMLYMSDMQYVIYIYT